MIFDERNYLIEEPFNRAFNKRNRLGTLNWLITRFCGRNLIQFMILSTNT